MGTRAGLWHHERDPLELCDCMDEPWYRMDLDPSAAPNPQWVCSTCLRVQGPAYIQAADQ